MQSTAERTGRPIPPSETAAATLTVQTVTGRRVGYANLDHAATAPCLTAVQTAVNELLPWYASAHRGAGLASQRCTEVYERARDSIARFVQAPADATVVLTRNTTDSFNLLAHCLPQGTTVLRFTSDHHAALLPWRGPVRDLAIPATPEHALDILDGALRRCPAGPRLVVLTGASNVTGELWPVRALTDVARRYGARVALDAAQLAPHRRLNMVELGVDWLALSGHKLYAPFGTGALVGSADWLTQAPPYLAGGGATNLVAWGDDDLRVDWSTVPARHEAGSPNVLGAHALATACETLSELGWNQLEEYEHGLDQVLRAGLRTLPEVVPLTMWGWDAPRVGVLSFAVEGHDLGLLAAALSAEYGIGVREGAFCAHIATRTLLRNAGSSHSRALRVSVGLGSQPEHAERFVDALTELIERGPAWTYRQHGGRWQPFPDPRTDPYAG